MNRGMRVLQTLALPLGYVTVSTSIICRLSEKVHPFLKLHCPHRGVGSASGAGNEARTRYLHLGKVALYQMSYARGWCPEPESNQRHVDFQSTALPTELSGRKKYFYEAARDRDRTGTGVTPQDFKSCASANSATRANLALFQPLNYYTKPAEICQQLFSIFFIFPSSKPW